MCIGTPMQVIEMRETHALCEVNGSQELIDMILVGDQKPGTWILNFLGGAREVLTPENAAQITQALTALDGIMNGEIEGPDGNQQIDNLFADLIDKEPILPPHLQALVTESPAPKNSAKLNPTNSQQETS